MPRRSSLRDHSASKATQGTLLLALGETYMGLGIYEKAETSFLRAHEDVKAGETGITASSQKQLADAGARIVALYDAWGEKQKADEWRKRLADAARTTEPQQ